MQDFVEEEEPQCSKENGRTSISAILVLKSALRLFNKNTQPLRIGFIKPKKPRQCRPTLQYYVFSGCFTDLIKHNSGFIVACKVTA